MEKRTKKYWYFGGIVIIGLIVLEVIQHQIASNKVSKTVTVGLVGSADRQIWEVVKKTAKQESGITIKFKTFSDYVQPNRALASGDIDLNAFQTVNFFKTQEKHFNNKLVSIGDTYMTPIRLYSNRYKKLADIPKGGTVVIPNDPSNETRALDLLQAAGLLTYDKKNKMPTIKDIRSNPKLLKIKEVQSDQAVNSLSSADAAVINTNYALDAKLDVNKALFVEPITKKSRGYFNIIVANKESKNQDIYKKVVDAYQSEATAKEMKRLYGKAEIPVWNK